METDARLPKRGKCKSGYKQQTVRQQSKTNENAGGNNQ